MEKQVNNHIYGLKEPTKQTDLLLVNSPLNDCNDKSRPNIEILPPIGLAYIATVCEAAGYNVGLLDPEISSLTPEKTAKLINELNPRWVGINLLTPTYTLARRIVSNLKPEILVMAGGAHAKALPEKTLRDPFFCGKIKTLALEDGEFIARGLLNAIPKEEMGGVAYIDERGNFVLKPFNNADKWIPSNLDALCHINRKFLPNDPFFSEGRLETSLSTSRGCCFNCAFCAGARESLLLNMRSRSIDSVLSELKELREQGITAVRFIDDLFLVSKNKITRFCEAMINSGLSQNLVWDTTSRVNVISDLDKKNSQLMLLSGCREVAIGIESSSDRILRILNKEITPDMTIKAVKNLSEAGIRTKGYFILGIPSETKTEMTESINFMHLLRKVSRMAKRSYPLTTRGTKNEAQFRGSMFEFRPYPGTFLYKCLTGKKSWIPETYNNGFKPGVFSEDDILTSFNPVHMGQLDTRQRHNYSINAPLADGVLPYEVQEMIFEAMQVQQEDIIQHSEYIPGLRVA